MNEAGDIAKTLSEDLYRRLRADILSSRFMPGERLAFENLKSLYGVGFSPIREALTHLVGDSLVMREGQKGFRVAPMSVALLDELTFTRQEVEALLLRKAIEIGDAAWEAEIVAALHQLGRTAHLSDDDTQLSETWLKLHRNFHHALVKASGLEILGRVWGQTFDQAERYRTMAILAIGDRRDDLREHRELADAVLARDTPRALAASRSHIARTHEIVLESVQRWETSGER